MSDNKKNIEKKAIPSSLRFPANSLESCLEKIKLLFEKNSNNLCSSDAITLDLGFSPDSGSASSLLASLKYYGFLEKVNDDKFKISDFILDYCISNELNQEILFKALHCVPINKKLFSTYDFNNLPSENELKNFLIKICLYNLKQAGAYLNTFNKNYSLYKEYKNKAQISDKIKDTLQPAYESAERLGLDIKPILDEKVNFLSKSIYNSTIQYPLSSNQYVSVHFPKDIKEIQLDDLEDIRDILELVLKKVHQQIEKKS